ncbi:hypothetical protein SAMN05421810_10360 [Amycolatopsis arida]|uniref:4-amino-4-deoxy-L-arabinose transferase n=1 Tax=Amycolatopsis arida TaxID=587909 RepID=A0A1I5S9K2_9PSEU|nr:DUF6541 family protein [Amycolatopsis arida]TDX85333.1 hypothetical protein CLV69_11660 [Amycolatopsis arida]SFP67392.1 hypothetical protein SAMN05421810_10360 [Amycolatopsis arida]
MNVLLVLLAFWLPGLAVGAAIRLRGWTLAAAAPALTFGVVAVGTIVLGRLGITWNLVNVAMWAALVALVLAAGSLLLARRWPPRAEAGTETETEITVERRRPPRDHLLIAGGVVVGMAVGVTAFLRGVGGLAKIIQEWDAPFHANAVRWIHEHGSALPSVLGPIANQADNPNYFYPDTYHALLATLFGTAGLDAPRLLNIAALATVLAWPLGIAALTAAWRMPTLAVAGAAAVSTWFTAFPFDPLTRGPLWPYAAGVALIPAVLAVARHLVTPRGPAGPLGVALGVTGLVGLHTSLGFVIAAYFLLILVAVLVGWERIDWRRSAPSLVGTAVLGVVLALPVVLPALSSAEDVTASIWHSEASPAGGFGQMLTFSPMHGFPQWWVGLPALAGIFLLVKQRRMMWMVGAFLLFGGLFAATVSLETPLIHTLTGPFYNDHWRIAALVPLSGAVAFGQFLSSASDGVAGKLGAWRPRWRSPLVPVAVAVVIGLVLGLISKGGYIGRNAGRLASIYTEGPTVTKGEREAYEWLGAHTVPGERVMNDLGDGSVWMYALAGVHPVEWTFYGSPEGSTPFFLTGHLNQADSNPAVREALADLGVRYVVLGNGYVRKYFKRVSGLTDLGTTESFQEVFRNQDAVIYRYEGVNEPVNGR